MVAEQLNHSLYHEEAVGAASSEDKWHSMDVQPFLCVSRDANVSHQEQETVEGCLILKTLQHHFRKDLSLRQTEKHCRSPSSSSFSSLVSERICCIVPTVRDLTAGTFPPPRFCSLNTTLFFCALLKMWKCELWCQFLQDS